MSILDGHSMQNEVPCSACGDLDGCHLPARIAQDRLTLEEFWHHHAEWSQRTFGPDSARGPEGPLKHMVKEIVTELFEDDENAKAIVERLNKLVLKKQPVDDSLEEYGDLLFLIFDATRRAGFALEQLRVQVNRKLKINRARKWGRFSSTEAVEHIRE